MACVASVYDVKFARVEAIINLYGGENMRMMKLALVTTVELVMGSGRDRRLYDNPERP